MTYDPRDKFTQPVEATDIEHKICGPGCEHICPRCNKHSMPFGACMACGWNAGNEIYNDPVERSR